MPLQEANFSSYNNISFTNTGLSFSMDGTVFNLVLLNLYVTTNKSNESIIIPTNLFAESNGKYTPFLFYNDEMNNSWISSITKVPNSKNPLLPNDGVYIDTYNITYKKFQAVYDNTNKTHSITEEKDLRQTTIVLRKDKVVYELQTFGAIILPPILTPKPTYTIAPKPMQKITYPAPSTGPSYGLLVVTGYLVLLIIALIIMFRKEIAKSTKSLLKKLKA